MRELTESRFGYAVRTGRGAAFSVPYCEIPGTETSPTTLEDEMLKLVVLMKRSFKALPVLTYGVILPDYV